MKRSQNFAQPFYWKKKKGWYIYDWTSQTYYKMSPVRIPNNGKRSKYQVKRKAASRAPSKPKLRTKNPFNMSGFRD